MKIENKDLLNPTLEISVGDYYLYNAETGIEMYSGTLSSHEISKTLGDPEDIKGGREGNVIYSIAKSAEVEIILQDIVNSQQLEAQKWGSSMKEVGDATVISFHMPKNYTLKSNAGKLEVTLDHTPLVADEVAVYNPKTKTKIDSAKVVVTANKVAITEANLVEGDQVLVTGFKYKADAKAKYSTISSQDTSATYFGVIEVPIYNVDADKIVMLKKYIFPKCKLASNVSSKGQSERKGVQSELKLKVMKDLGQNALGTIVYEDVVTA